jgi:hypothetical protein
MLLREPSDSDHPPAIGKDSLLLPRLQAITDMPIDNCRIDKNHGQLLAKGQIDQQAPPPDLRNQQLVPDQKLLPDRQLVLDR